MCKLCELLLGEHIAALLTLLVGPRPVARHLHQNFHHQSTNRTSWHIIHEATHGDRWGSPNNPLRGPATEGSQPPVNFRAPEPSDFFGCIRCPNAPLTMAPRYETVPGPGWPWLPGHDWLQRENYQEMFTSGHPQSARFFISFDRWVTQAPSLMLPCPLQYFSESLFGFGHCDSFCVAIFNCFQSVARCSAWN